MDTDIFLQRKYESIDRDKHQNRLYWNSYVKAAIQLHRIHKGTALHKLTISNLQDNLRYRKEYKYYG